MSRGAESSCVSGSWVSILQTRLAAADAAVDFGEFYSILAGEKNVKASMFVMRLSHSGFLAT